MKMLVNFTFSLLILNLKYLNGINSEKPSRLNNLDGKLYWLYFLYFYQSLKEGLHTLEACKSYLELPAAILSAFLLYCKCKFIKRRVFDQTFSVNKLNSEFQHAYKQGHSTSAALMQMIDQWLSDTDRNRMVGAVPQSCLRQLLSLLIYHFRLNSWDSLPVCQNWGSLLEHLGVILDM